MKGDEAMKKMEVDTLVPPSEKILWKGQPNRKGLVLESIFNPMLIFALIWLFFDGMAMIMISQSMKPDPSKDVPNPGFEAFLPYLLFFAVHLMPVWIYLGGIISTFVKGKRTHYVLTDKAMYVFTGGVRENTLRLGYRDTEYISVKRGVFDRMLKVGDVVDVTVLGVDAGRKRISLSMVES